MWTRRNLLGLCAQCFTLALSYFAFGPVARTHTATMGRRKGLIISRPHHAPSRVAKSTSPTHVDPKNISIHTPPVTSLVLSQALGLCGQSRVNNSDRCRAFCDVHRDILTTKLLPPHSFRYHHHLSVSHNSPALDKTHAAKYYHFSNNVLPSSLSRLLQLRTAFNKFEGNAPTFP